MARSVKAWAVALAVASVGLPVASASICGVAPSMPPLTFDEPILVDEGRAGGEPHVQPLPDGTLVYVSHAGTTHMTGARHPDLAYVTPYTNSNYVWRSIDDGDSWRYVGLAGLDAGPHAVTGFSDPATAVDTAGNLFVAGIDLANVYVAKSTDGGQTFVGNPFAAVLTDREWLAADTEDVVYMNGNQSGRMLWRSADGGLTWTAGVRMEGGGPPSPIAVDQRTGVLYFPGGSGAARDARISIYPNARAGDLDTVEHGIVPAGLPRAHGFLNPIAVDDAGHVYVVANTYNEIRVSASTDGGRHWRTTTVHRSANSVIWPWISAGGEGRVAVSWLQADADLRNNPNPAWRIAAAGSISATGWVDGCGGEHPPVWSVAQVTNDPIHVGGICPWGLNCQVAIDSDRRLGDYHTNAITEDGRLVIATGATTIVPDSAISRPLFIRQSGGADLRP